MAIRRSILTKRRKRIRKKIKGGPFDEGAEEKLNLIVTYASWSIYLLCVQRLY